MDVLTIVVTAFISSLIGAIIAALVSQLIEAGKQSAKDVKKAQQEAKEMRDTLNQNTIMTCRMAIYDEHFSIDEKIEAYIIYRNKGANHRTKEYMDKQVGGDIDAYLVQHGILDRKATNEA